MIRTRAVAAVLLLCLAVVATGCSSVQEALKPEPKVVTEEATVAVAGAPVQGELSADTPTDLPLWPDATVVESTSTEDAYTLSLTTTDAFDDVLGGVAVGFEQAGWQVASEESGEQGSRVAVLTVTGDAQEGVVTFTEDGTGTVGIDYVISAVQ